MRGKFLQALLGLTNRATRSVRQLNSQVSQVCRNPTVLPALPLVPPTGGIKLVQHELIPIPFVRSLLPYGQIYDKLLPSSDIFLKPTTILCKKKKKKSKIDDCSGRTDRRRSGFNKSCPPPPKKCPPGSTKPRHRKHHHKHHRGKKGGRKGGKK